MSRNEEIALNVAVFIVMTIVGAGCAAFLLTLAIPQ